MTRGASGAAGEAEHAAGRVARQLPALAAPAGVCLLVRCERSEFTVAARGPGDLRAPRPPDVCGESQGVLEALAANGVALQPGAASVLRAALHQTARGGTPVSFSLALQAGDDTSGISRAWHYASVTLTPARERAEIGHVVLRVELEPEGGVASTREEELASELRERTRELEGALAQLDALGYAVSHDLRAPLRAIDGFSHALAQDCAEHLDARGREYLERVQCGARRLSSMLDDLLELARLERAPLERLQVDVTSAARRAIAELQQNHAGHSPRVEIEEGLAARADPRLLQRLLEQLLGNAWKFTRGEPQALIRVGREPGYAVPVFFVADDGVGFDMAHAGRLFAPFARLHRATDYPGNGVGLAMARRIVARHGGRIWAEAAPGRGARFCFRLEPADDRP